MTILIAHRPNAEGAAALEMGVAGSRLRGDELLVLRHFHVGG